MNFKYLRTVLERLSYLIPSSFFMRIKYRYHTGENLSLKNPKKFSEKINWLKLNYHQPEYVTYVDKYNVRSFIRSAIGEQYLVRIIGVYDRVEEIDWNELPNRFVMKSTHGSGSNIICIDKTNLNIEESKKIMNTWLKKNWYWYGREWPYRYVKPRIICEEYLLEGNVQASITDFKFYCFNGKPTFCQVIKDRGTDQTIDFFDLDWNHKEFTGLQKNSTRSDGNMEKPENYKKMIELAKILSKEHPFVRVDLYNVSNKIYFGELTFYPVSGFGKFYPSEWNVKIGELLKLPLK